MTNKIEILTEEQALAMLPDGDCIHTRVQAGFALLGADWNRKGILDLIGEGICKVAGPMATASGHGLVVWDGKKNVFIETKEADNEN